MHRGHWAEGSNLPSWTAGVRVLVVDDNVDAAETLAELLVAMGCEARVAHDGPGALLAAQDFGPALVLLDIGLPVMDGYELASRLRATRLATELQVLDREPSGTLVRLTFAR